MKNTPKNTNYNSLTKEQLVEAILKLKVQLNSLEEKVDSINKFLVLENQIYINKRK
jgi:hypothetical protein